MYLISFFFLVIFSILSCVSRHNQELVSLRVSSPTVDSQGHRLPLELLNQFKIAPHELFESQNTLVMTWNKPITQWPRSNHITRRESETDIDIDSLDLSPKTLNFKAKRIGNSTSWKCEFPKLRLELRSPEDEDLTPRSFYVVFPCDRSQRNDNNAEFLAYHLLRAMGGPSLHARRVIVNFPKGSRVKSLSGFILEDVRLRETEMQEIYEDEQDGTLGQPVHHAAATLLSFQHCFTGIADGGGPYRWAEPENSLEETMSRLLNVFLVQQQNGTDGEKIGVYVKYDFKPFQVDAANCFSRFMTKRNAHDFPPLHVVERVKEYLLEHKSVALNAYKENRLGGTSTARTLMSRLKRFYSALEEL